MDFTVLICGGKQLELTDDLRQFPEVVLDARDSELITDVARRAQADIGVDWEWPYHHFVTQRDMDGRRYQAPFLTAYVDEDGSVSWSKHGLKGVTVADVERSRGERVFAGDPHALLIEEPLGGDGVLPGWDDLLQLLIRLGEVGAGATFLAQASKGFLSILRACQRQWALRGAMPASLLGLILEREEWNYAQLARYLSVSLPIAVELLEYLGYVQDESEVRLFRLSDGPEKAALRNAIENELIGNSRENRRWFWEVQGTSPPSA